MKAADAKTALADSLPARSKGPLIRTVLYEIISQYSYYKLPNVV